MRIKIISILFLFFFALSSQAQKTNVISISQDMMTSLKMNLPLSDYETQLAIVAFETLNNQLDTDLKKQAFWANIYIVYSQKLINQNGECKKGCRNQKIVTVGNRVFSLNDILYKILLHSKSKITGGKNLIASKWEKELRVNYPDGRVLLAIDSHDTIANAVTYYEPEKMDAQLNETSRLFLVSFVYYDLDKNLVYLPLWIKRFKREFGKKSGVIAGLKRAEIIPENIIDTRIEYSDKIATFK